MSDEILHQSSETEPSVSREGRSPVPVAFIILLALLLYWGMVHLDSAAGGFNPKVYEPYASLAMVDAAQPPPTEGPDLRKGAQVYNTYCQVCHQANGMGTPGQCPPLAGSDWVAHPSANRIIRIVMKGATGPITVSGKPHNYTMTAFGEVLSDADIVNVLSFVRMNKDWGNSAPPVPMDQVKDIRKKVESHPGMFSPDTDLSRLSDNE